MKLHIATSRPEEIGCRCIDWAYNQGYRFVDMEECEVFISILYDQILSKEFLRDRRCYNFHPGILPHYRGSGAYSWSIINGAKETGVTLHEIESNIDSGPIIDIQRISITEKDTAESLFKRSMNVLFEMFKLRLPSLLEGNYYTLSNVGGKIYYRKQLEEAKDLTRYIRAFSFQGKEPAYWIDSKGNKREIKWE